MLEGWRSWADSPPQIPWAPIKVRLMDDHSCTFIACASGVLRVPEIVQLLAWCSTGIYRQEYFEVTGQWL